jgi:hypothetical protein
MITSQRLDYLRVPFHCTRCIKMCHLKKERQIPFGVHIAESSLKDSVTNGYPMKIDTLEQSFFQGSGELDEPTTMDTTFVGKLRHYVPSLYCSLSAWERNLLDSIFSEVSTVNEVLHSPKARVSEMEGRINPSYSTLSPLALYEEGRNQPAPTTSPSLPTIVQVDSRQSEDSPTLIEEGRTQPAPTISPYLPTIVQVESR